MKKLAENIEQYLAGLHVTQGYRVGLPFELFPWQKKFLKGVFRHTDGDALLSIARGGGKTTLISGIGCATIDENAPLMAPRGDTVIVGPSLDQAKLSFAHILAFLGPKLYDRKRFKLWDTRHNARIENKSTGATLQCRSCLPERLHGIAPSFLILDEPAQWPRNVAQESYQVLQTSRGKIDGSRLITMGTRPVASLDHFFNDLMTEARYSQVHCASGDDDPFARRTWNKACPSLKSGGMPALLRQYREESERARHNPAVLASFRALRLNLGMRPVNVSHVVSPEDWQQAEGVAEPTGQYVLGLDLSDGHAMCGASAFWLETGKLEAMAAFPSVPSLAERGLADGVGDLYLCCHDRHELILTPGRAVSVSHLLGECLKRWGRPCAIVADRYRSRDLRQALDEAKFPQSNLIHRGMGYKDGAEDVRLFRRAIFENKVVPEESLLLRAAFSEALTCSDPAGNAKLAKSGEGSKRGRAKDDAAAAAILAVAEGMRRRGLVTSNTLNYVICG